MIRALRSPCVLALVTLAAVGCRPRVSSAPPSTVGARERSDAIPGSEAAPRGEQPEPADEGAASSDADLPARDEPAPSADKNTRKPDDAATPWVRAVVRTPGPLTIVPATPTPSTPRDRETRGRSATGHVSAFGWTADAQQFVFCVPDRSPAGQRCAELGRGGSRAASDRARAPAATAIPDPQLPARLAALAPGADDWAFGADDLVEWRTRGGEGRPLLVELGARGRSTRTRTATVSVAFDVDVEDAHVELVAASPDGEALAVLVHADPGGTAEAFVPRIVGAAELIADAEDEAGRVALAAGDARLAADRFARAAALGARWEPAYHLAWALVALADPAAEAALAEASRRDRARTRSSAAGDPRFAPVRATPWFRALVGS